MRDDPSETDSPSAPIPRWGVGREWRIRLKGRGRRGIVGQGVSGGATQGGSRTTHRQQYVLALDSPGRAVSSHNSAGCYGRVFWYAYLANTCLVVANSLLFRYADFVSYLGGTEFQLGLIVGTGMIGSLAMRVVQGTAIDRCGPRQIWLWSLALYVACVLGHLLITRIDGPAIFLARMAYATSLAGAFGSSITAVSRRATVTRMAEVIGTLGSSGFLGMMIGPMVGDLLCHDHDVGRNEVVRLFATAAILGTIAFAAVFYGIHPENGRRRRRVPNPLRLAHRYGNFAVVVAATAMGAGLNLPMYFLRPFTASLRIQGIGLFFGVYCPVAFAVRLWMRGLPERWGNRPLILLGSACTIVGTASFLTVSSPGHLIVPAVILGAAHALVFPTVTAEGSGGFPDRYRGLGTTLILGALDLGGLIGAPLIGFLLWMAGQFRVSPYPFTFVVVSGMLLVAAGTYWALSRRQAPPRGHRLATQPAVPSLLHNHVDGASRETITPSAGVLVSNTAKGVVSTSAPGLMPRSS